MDEIIVGFGKLFGEGVNVSLILLLEFGEKEGFIIKNFDGFVGYIEWGEGDDIVGVFCYVDVVLSGDGWMSDLFLVDICNGWIYVRGVIDDKGLMMVVFYVLKIVKDMNLLLFKCVRIIIGIDEESDWRCVEYYFKYEEMLMLGFVFDVDFLIINVEKGIIDILLFILYCLN